MPMTAALPHIGGALCESSIIPDEPTSLLWPPYGIGHAIIFLPCDFYLLLLYGRPA